MTHGPEYKTNGKRPVWLKDGDAVTAKKCSGVSGQMLAKFVEWDNTSAIRLPAGHWANPAIGAGLEPWVGSDEAPEDWDGGKYLTSGLYYRKPLHPIDWRRNGFDCHIIGYKKKDIAVSELPKDVTALVVVARKVWDDIDFITSDSVEGRELDKALEAFSSRVPYEDEPNESAVSENTTTYAPEGLDTWAIGEAMNECGHDKGLIPHSAIYALARLIQKHEPHRKPKDRDEEIAEKWIKHLTRLPNGLKVDEVKEAILAAIKEAKS